MMTYRAVNTVGEFRPGEIVTGLPETRIAELVALGAIIGVPLVVPASVLLPPDDPPEEDLPPEDGLPPPDELSPANNLPLPKSDAKRSPKGASNGLPDAK